MYRLNFLLGSLWLTASLSAQLPIGGPVEGFVFDKPTRSFRGVVGTLGSASLGGTLAGPYEFGSIAPLHKHGVGWIDGHLNVVSRLGTDQPIAIDISADGSFPKPERAAWSSDGSVAVLYSLEGNWILSVSGLPDSPSIGTVVDVSSTGGTLAAVAVDVNGEQVIIAAAGEFAGIYRLQDGLRFVQLADLGEPAALSFSSDSKTLYAIDAADKRVIEMNLMSLAVDSWEIEGIHDPIALCAARDAEGQILVHVAGGSDRLILTFDARNRQAVSRLDLSFTPGGIEQLGLGSFLLRTRESDGDPLWSFTTAATPLVRFVPASPLVREEPGQ